MHETGFTHLKRCRENVYTTSITMEQTSLYDAHHYIMRFIKHTGTTELFFYNVPHLSARPRCDVYMQAPLVER